MANNKRFSQSLTIFHERHLPEKQAFLAGYAAIIKAYSLKVPLPQKLAIISSRHRKYESEEWLVFTPRYKPNDTLYDQLIFALKYEGVNLTVLRALFLVVELVEISRLVLKDPVGQYSRRIWFLYEWLLGTKLNLPDAQKGNYVSVLDDKLQYPGPSRYSRRHLVNNNLPGTKNFCPLIQRTKLLDTYISMNLGEKAQQNIGKVHPDILARAAAFLLLEDSKASYNIEGEKPSHNRLERWGKAIGQAGKNELSTDELYRLQKIVITDSRFVQMGYRKQGGFIGIHDRRTGLPIPSHISACTKDLELLMDGLIETNRLLKNNGFDPILMATMIAFGFVFIHPFEDGNGRIHRYLLHHVLVETSFAKKGIVFPVSAAILENIDKYKKVLQLYSEPRLELIKWRPTSDGNVEVLNETIDLYRYFDVTKQAEFLFECVQKTVEVTLPEEVNYLEKYDLMQNFIQNYLEMPDSLIDLLIRFLGQGNGKLSKRAQEREFKALTKQEITVLEKKYSQIFLH